MKKVLIITVIVLLCTRITFAQRISPYQSGSYYPGLVSLCDYAAAPAGLILLDYNYWMSSSGYYDKDGEKFTRGTINLPPPNNPINIDINPGMSGYMNVPGLFYVSKFKVFGALYMASIYPIYQNFYYKVIMATGDTSTNISGSVSGWGDLSAMPLGLSWTFDNNMDLSFMYTFYAMEQATALAIIPTFEFNGEVKDAESRAGNLEYRILNDE